MALLTFPSHLDLPFPSSSLSLTLSLLGRESVLGTLFEVMGKIPQGLLEEYCHMLFLPLVQLLVNTGERVDHSTFFLGQLESLLETQVFVLCRWREHAQALPAGPAAAAPTSPPCATGPPL